MIVTQIYYKYTKLYVQKTLKLTRIQFNRIFIFRVDFFIFIFSRLFAHKIYTLFIISRYIFPRYFLLTGEKASFLNTGRITPYTSKVLTVSGNVYLYPAATFCQQMHECSSGTEYPQSHSPLFACVETFSVFCTNNLIPPLNITMAKDMPATQRGGPISIIIERYSLL